MLEIDQGAEGAEKNHSLKLFSSSWGTQIFHLIIHDKDKTDNRITRRYMGRPCLQVQSKAPSLLLGEGFAYVRVGRRTKLLHPGLRGRRQGGSYQEKRPPNRPVCGGDRMDDLLYCPTHDPLTVSVLFCSSLLIAGRLQRLFLNPRVVDFVGESVGLSIRSSGFQPTCKKPPGSGANTCPHCQLGQATQEPKGVIRCGLGGHFS